MKLRKTIRKFCVRYVNAAKNDNAYENFMKDTRRKMLEIKYDMEVLESVYKKKEEEKKNELLRNIEQLQTKKDNLQKEFDEANEKDRKALMEEYILRREYYENKADAFVNKLEELDLKRIALEKEISGLEEKLPPKEVPKPVKKESFFKRLCKPNI